VNNYICRFSLLNYTQSQNGLPCKSLVKLLKACRVQGQRPCSLTKESGKEEKTTHSETKQTHNNNKHTKK